MKKKTQEKKEKSKPSLAVKEEVEEEEELDLKSLIRQESLFFDKLVESIPARFYISSEKEGTWFQGLSKVAKASAKKETKEKIKKARRDRLDPEKASLTTVDILHQTLAKKNKNQKEKDDLNETEIENPKRRGGEEEDRSVTYEELKAKLHRKIEELRSNRHAGPDDMSNRMKKREVNQGKRKRDEFEENKSKPNAPPKVAAAAAADTAKMMEEDVVKASEGLAFSHVKIGIEDGRGRKRKKLSKQQELEEARKLEQAKKDPDKGEIVAKKHSWKAATERAAGVKVHDDPKLVSKSIKKEKKKQQKNADRWKERIETVEKKRAEKQQTRSEHISERIQQKKQRKIAKREKKLMRPGFEGRKEGYINGS